MSVKKKAQEKLLNISQTLIDKLYEKEGLTDEVLELQVKLNTMRSEADIHDKNLVNDDGFVQ